MPEAGTINMKLEVVTLPVSDVDRAKRFYQSLGWRLDATLPGDPFSFPRLVGPAEWDCFLSVKSVDRIEVTREPQQATAATIALARLERQADQP